MKSIITIVVPAYNPHEGWEKLLANRFQELTQSINDFHFQLLLINDGSKQFMGNEEIGYLQSNIPAFSFINSKVNLGKGAILRQAIAEVHTEYLIYTDIDMPFTLQSIAAIVQQLREFDVVFGIKNQDYYSQLPLQRKLVSKTLQMMIGILFPSLPVADTQCGLKGMNEKGKQVFLATKVQRYLFDLEFIALAAKRGLKLKPVEVALRPGIIFGGMSLKILMQEFRNLLRIMVQK